MFLGLVFYTSWVKQWSEAMDFLKIPRQSFLNLHSKGMQKNPEIYAKIWPYIKNSNLHSKGMQKNQKFTKKYLISKILTCIQKVCKKTEILSKIWPYIKNSNLHSKGMQKKQKFMQIKAVY
jgi:chromatin remodeling complex protein RSC6